MQIARFEPRHLVDLKLQDAQAYMTDATADLRYGEMLAECDAFTALDGRRVIACAGVVEQWENRAVAWALVSRNAGPHMLGLVRAIEGFLMQARWRRIEAAVDLGFAPGERLLRMLGFEREGLCRAYRPDGGDCTLWARVKHGGASVDLDRGGNGDVGDRLDPAGSSGRAGGELQRAAA